MRVGQRLFLLLLVIALSPVLTGCASLKGAFRWTLPESKLVEMSVLVTSANIEKVQSGSRIVIAGIGGECASELKNALMRRLVDNAGYDVLSRDQLNEIMFESQQTWAGEFNSSTAVELGELLGASLFLVGEVVYCGQQSYPYESSDTYNPEVPYDIFAVLQIVDIRTGKVILSSSNEGSFFPGADPLLFLANSEEYERLMQDSSATKTLEDEHAKRKKERRKRARKVARMVLKGIINFPGKIFDGFIPSSVKQKIAAEEEATKQETAKDAPSGAVNYPAFKAAEDLANGFADKFFARPTWEKVEMWESSYWRYGDSVRYVKLGHCPIAVELMESVAERELPRMPDKDVAEYLHNYGVALLCANQPEKALEKLRSSYRIGYHPATMRMLGLASQIMEWSLDIKIDEQPEVDMLIDRRADLLETKPVKSESEGSEPVGSEPVKSEPVESETLNDDF